MQCMAAIYPIGSNEWDIVFDEYKKWALANNYDQRSKESLQSYYNRIRSSKKPTGTPEKVALYERAHEIQAMIEARIHIAGDDTADCDAGTAGMSRKKKTG